MPRRQVLPISTGRLRIQATSASATARRSQPPPASSAPPSARHICGVVGDLPGLQPQPAAADDLPVYPYVATISPARHEFDGRAQRVAHGEAEVGAERAVEKRQVGHRGGVERRLRPACSGNWRAAHGVPCDRAPLGQGVGAPNHADACRCRPRARVGLRAVKPRGSDICVGRTAGFLPNDSLWQAASGAFSAKQT